MTAWTVQQCEAFKISHILLYFVLILGKVFMPRQRCFNILILPRTVFFFWVPLNFFLILFAISLWPIRFSWFHCGEWFAPIVHAHLINIHSMTMNHKNSWLRSNKELVVDELALIYVCISTFRHCDAPCWVDLSCAVLSSTQPQPITLLVWLLPLLLLLLCVMSASLYDQQKKFFLKIHYST